MAKRRKWIKRGPTVSAGVLDPIGVWTAEGACREAIEKINAAAAIDDAPAVAIWRRRLEARCPGLREALKRSGSTLKPPQREELEHIDRGLGRLFPPSAGTRR